MPPAAGVVSQSDRVPVVGPTPMLMSNHHHHHLPHVMQPGPGPAVMPESFAKDAIIAWFRGEFAAANAIIDALCAHLKQLDDLGSGYDSVFAAIHRRRLNWIPILQMQKYYSIADVAVELRKASLSKKIEREAAMKVTQQQQPEEEEEKMNALSVTAENEKSGEFRDSESEETSFPEDVDSQHGHHQSNNENGNGNGDVVDDSPESEITDTGKYIFRPPLFFFSNLLIQTGIKNIFCIKKKVKSLPFQSDTCINWQ